MSYDLEVWKESKPITTQDAADKIRKYWDENDKSVFLDHLDVELFAREIIEIFPFDLPDNQTPIWSGFDETKAFISMNIGFSYIQEALPRILEIAAKYELVCFDGQRGIIHYSPSIAAMGYLRLEEMESGKIIDCPTKDEVRQVISSLEPDKNKFASFEKKDHFYIQTKILDHDDFTFEYREGSADQHFQTENVSREEIIQAFIEYSKNQNDWKERYRWTKLNFEKPN